MTKTNADYYLGLDIGTNSVGWAVTDESYNILRAKGRDAWGVRLFEEAKTAEERRSSRSSRRLTQRKRQRLDLLREIFEDEINVIDEDFFLKLDESKFYLEDKKINSKYNLFSEPGFTDKDYYKKYPTIFHLRNDLMDTKKKRDIRLYFLAINQILKKRGHFLFEGQKIDNITDLTPYIEKLAEIFESEGLDEEIDDDFYTHLMNILLDKESNKNEKKSYYTSILKSKNLNKNKMVKEIGNLLISGKVKLSKLFDDEELEDIEENEIIFADENFDDKIHILEDVLNERVNLIINLKAIYDYVILQGMLDGENYISKAQVSKFNKHKEDLERLKRLVKKYDDENKTYYNKVFKSSAEKYNYAAYIGYTVKNSKKIKVKKCNSEDFNKFIAKTLEKICNKGDTDYKKIISDIDHGNFMPKQITNVNSFIPYQLHYMELERILNNLKRDYPSFEKEEDGINKIKKIELLFKFRIPYYVGPLNNSHSKVDGGNAWIVKNEEFLNTKIRPWNFEKVVDLKESEKAFIRSMTNYCTYLRDKEVIPKNSILYSQYMVLNELNNLKINNRKIQPELKEEIINNIFKKYKKVTINRLKTYLIKNNYADEDVVFGGIDGDFKASFNSYIDFKDILKEDFDENKVEELIEYIIIHSGNKKIIKEKVEELFPNISNKQKIKISSIKYSGWGRFSKEFLTKFKGEEKETGKQDTIIGFLKSNDDNLVQLLSSRYTFSEKLVEYNQKFVPKNLSYDMLEDLYISPSVKKMTWQSIKIIEEITKVFNKEPKRIFIEMARGREEKRARKESRKSKLLNLYKTVKGDRDFKSEIESRTDAEFRSERLFLYYTQMGKCMYSGENISLDALFDKDTYDIDHIIPKSLKKDDSTLNNKVLVKKDLNQRVKGDMYPVPESIRNNPEVRKIWDFLKEKGFIEKEKYNRLTRSTKLSNEELAEFINRQLVETRQTTKVVADLLKDIYNDSKIVYVKAKTVSEFRQDYGILKSRDANNFHHAHDAYLNIVVGNAYYTKFTSNPLNFVKGNKGNYTLNNIFRFDIKNSKGDYVWKKDDDIDKIKKTIEKNSIKVTRESYQGSGELFDLNPVSKRDIKKNQVYMPLKADKRLNNIEKYGAYNSVKGAYFSIVEHTLKNKKVLTIEQVPIYLVGEIEKNGDEVILDYLINTLKLVSPKIIIPKVLMKTHVKIDGFDYTLNGKTGNYRTIQPIEEPHWNINQTELIKYVVNLVEKSEKYKTDITGKEDREKIIELISLIQDKLDKEPFNRRIKIPQEIKDFDANKCDLSILNLAKLAREILIFVTPVYGTVNLELIGGKGNVGLTYINKEISKLNQFIIVDESPAGFFRKEKDVLKLWAGDK